jgi:beta-glucanase (GH16 family)
MKQLLNTLKNLYYKVRFSFINNTIGVETWDLPGMKQSLRVDFAISHLFPPFNRYFSEGKEDDPAVHNYLPKLSCILYSEKNVTLVSRKNRDTETVKDFPFECGMLHSKGTFSQLYGLFELICKVPTNEGMYWPAFWLYGEAWPPEIDIFEMMADQFNDRSETRHFSTTFHYLQDGVHKQIGRRLRSRQVLSNDFHKYSLLWAPDKMVWYFDDIPIYELIGMSPDKPMHVVINTAAKSTPEQMGDMTGEMELSLLKVYKFIN